MPDTLASTTAPAAAAAPVPIACGSCAYWDPLSINEGDLGYCRRHAPLVGKMRNETFQTVWPETFDDDWCGEHQARRAATPAAPAGGTP
jgi:hypothetical protein